MYKLRKVNSKKEKNKCLNFWEKTFIRKQSQNFRQEMLILSNVKHDC